MNSHKFNNPFIYHEANVHHDYQVSSDEAELSSSDEEILEELEYQNFIEDIGELSEAEWDNHFFIQSSSPESVREAGVEPLPVDSSDEGISSTGSDYDKDESSDDDSPAMGVEIVTGWNRNHQTPTPYPHFSPISSDEEDEDNKGYKENPGSFPVMLNNESRPELVDLVSDSEEESKDDTIPVVKAESEAVGEMRNRKRPAFSEVYADSETDDAIGSPKRAKTEDEDSMQNPEAKELEDMYKAFIEAVAQDVFKIFLVKILSAFGYNLNI